MFRFFNFNWILARFRCYIFGFDDLAGAVIISGLVSAGASVASGIYNHFQNKKNNAAMMDFQRNSYKYTAQDMNNAGLNPALLASGSASPSSTPALNSSEMDLSPVAGIASTALQSKTQKSIADASNSTQTNIADNNNKTQSDIASGNNSTQATIAAGNNATSKEVAAMNNATQLALKSKDEELIKAQVDSLNASAENARAQAAEQKRSTKYWTDTGADPSSSDKFKLAKEAASVIIDSIKASGNSFDPSKVSTVIDKYNSLGREKFVKFYPSYPAFCRAVAKDTGSNEKTLVKDRSLMSWYKNLKGE